MPGNVVLVTGASGSGKTALTEDPSFPRNLATPIRFSSIMKEIMSGTADWRNKSLEQLFPKERAQVQAKAKLRLLEIAREKPLVIDGHLVVAGEHGFVSGLPRESLFDLDLAAIVIVQAPPEQIAARNSLRKHGMVDASRIALHHHLTICAAMHYMFDARRSPAIIEMLENSDGKRAEAVNALSQQLRYVIT